MVLVTLWYVQKMQPNFIRESIMAERENSLKDVPIMNDKEHDDLVKMLMDSTTLIKKEELDIQVNPNDARTHQTKKMK